jgi:hypothetical protein
MKSLIPVVTLVTLAGCLHVQRPATLALGSGASTDAVARALALAGHPPSDVSHATGVLTTEWRDTGFRYGAVDGQYATLVRRYLAVVSPAGILTLRAELKQCPTGGFTIGGVTIRGTCQAVDGVPESMQAELDALAGAVSQALEGQGRTAAR